jgi:hypothetical protein
MIIYWLNNGFPTSKALEMLSHQGQIIRIRMQSANTNLQAGSSIVKVVVIEADMLNTFRAKDTRHPICQSRFTRTAIAAYRDN